MKYIINKADLLVLPAIRDANLLTTSFASVSWPNPCGLSMIARLVAWVMFGILFEAILKYWWSNKLNLKNMTLVLVEFNPFMSVICGPSSIPVPLNSSSCGCYLEPQM